MITKHETLVCLVLLRDNEGVLLDVWATRLDAVDEIKGPSYSR